MRHSSAHFVSGPCAQKYVLVLKSMFSFNVGGLLAGAAVYLLTAHRPQPGRPAGARDCTHVRPHPHPILTQASRALETWLVVLVLYTIKLDPWVLATLLGLTLSVSMHCSL